MEDLELSAGTGALSLITRVARLLAERGVESYLVGGLVRDLLLGRDTADIDIAVAADALVEAGAVADSLGGRFVLLDEANGVGRVVLAVDEAPGKDRRQLDFTTLRGDIANDLSCRDFTIDAMAVRLEDIVSAASGASPEGQGGISLRADMLVDPCGGLDDLRRGVIRAVREDVFTADAVRVLRAARLSAELGFRIDAPTEELMRRDGRLVGGIPGERVREELLRALAVPGAGRLLSYLDELGVLTVIIPELASARGVEQPWVHFWDVLNHSLQTVAAAEFLLGEGEWAYAVSYTHLTLPTN